MQPSDRPVWRAALPPAALPAEALVQARLPANAGRRTGSAWLAWDARWGWAPALSVISALGLAVISAADALARAGQALAQPLFWAGLAIIVTPVAIRLLSARAARRERIALVLLLGLALYLVKVVHSPVAFTFLDEMQHMNIASRTLEANRLFQPNYLNPAMSAYPGLETVTTALVRLSGLSIFDAGLIVVGAARLLIVLALFLLAERVGGSARLAGMAALLYTANPNYVFWSAQFSYESLALALGLPILFIVVRGQTDRARGLSLVAGLAILALAVTHHLTMYAVDVFLVTACVLSALLSRGRHWGPWPLAILALAATLAWLAGVAGGTSDYLGPVLRSSAQSVLDMLAGKQAPRQLFQSSGGGAVAPLWERGVGLGAVLLMALGAPFGLRQVWLRYRRNPFAWIMAGSAMLYFAMLGLRFVPAAWETANRSSEFLFVGLAFILALGVATFRAPARWLLPIRTVLVVCAVVLLAGGIISGWQPNVRLARPYEVQADSVTILPQGVSVAQWMRAALGPDNVVIADPSNGGLLLAYGKQFVPTARKYGIVTLLRSARVGSGEQSSLQAAGAQYLLMDCRVASWDALAGLYFDRSPGNQFLSEVCDKFDEQPGVSRFLDSGNIALYDVRALSSEP